MKRCVVSGLVEPGYGSHVMAKLVKIGLGAMWQSRRCMVRRSEASFVEPVEACYAEVTPVAVRSCKAVGSR